MVHQIEHGQHVFRAYFKDAILRQYEKFSVFLRNELYSNNLYDFGINKGLDNLYEVRQKFQTIIGRFASFQAQWLNVHVDFPLLQRVALPTTIGSVRYPGIKIHDTRVIRLLEVLLHSSTHVGGCTYPVCWTSMLSRRNVDPTILSRIVRLTRVCSRRGSAQATRGCGLSLYAWPRAAQKAKRSEDRALPQHIDV
jgi:hypothetical protein